MKIIWGSNSFKNHNLPEKKTYRVMRGINEFLNDKEKAQEYKMLDRQARARLHYLKHKKAETTLIEKADSDYSDSKIGFFKELLMLRAKSVYEKAMSVYYYYF